MQIEHRCSPCHGTGTIVTHDPYNPPTEVPCTLCGAKGYTTEEVLFPEYDLLAAELDKIVRKVNKLQDDVTIILGKV